MFLCKRAFCLLVLLMAQAAFAQQEHNKPYQFGAPPQPHWTLEFKTGEFEPDIDEWEIFYGKDHTDQFGFGLAYKIIRQVEAGLELNYARDKGAGNLPLNGIVGGSVTHHLFPVHAYVVLRGIFYENQPVVPYIGGGITRAYYRQEVDNQESVRGKTDGDHTRAGLQILLDWMDTASASGFETEASVVNSYLALEVQSFSAKVNGIELGGETTYIGLMFEF